MFGDPADLRLRSCGLAASGIVLQATLRRDGPTLCAAQPVGRRSNKVVDTSTGHTCHAQHTTTHSGSTGAELAKICGQATESIQLGCVMEHSGTELGPAKVGPSASDMHALCHACTGWTQQVRD